MTLLSFTVDSSKSRKLRGQKKASSGASKHDFSFPGERGLNLFKLLFCLSRLTEATVMCFDHCVTTGQWASLQITDIFLLGHTTIMCASVHACLFDGKWGEDPAEPTETEQTTSSLSRHLLHVLHTHCPHTRWDSLVIYLHIHTREHASTICLVGFWSNLAPILERTWLWCWSVSVDQLTMERAKKKDYFEKWRHWKS